MKTITYWEGKLAQAQGRLATLESLGIRKPRKAPLRKVLRGMWKDARTRWEAADRRYRMHLKDVAKLKARIEFFKNRIAMTMPTFWERL